MKKGDQGFTLIELVIVVAIIGILASVVTGFFKRRDPVQSQQAALEWVKDTRPDAQPIGASCTERDTGSELLSKDISPISPTAVPTLSNQ